MSAALRTSDGPAGADPAAAAPPARSDLKRGSLIGVLVGLMLGILMGALDNTIVVTALPAIVTDLGDRTGLAFVVTAYLVAQTVSMPIFGRLSDHFGRRQFFLLGLVLFMGGSVLSGASQNFNELLVFRAVQGIGSGAFFPVANSIIGVLYSPRERARLTGIFSSVFGVAIVVGPLLGSVIVDSIGWRWIFYVNIPIGLVSFSSVLLTLGPLRASDRMGRFDWQGASLLAGWVAPLVFVLNQVTEGWAWTDPATVGLLAASAALFGAFLWWEGRAAEPLIPLRFFRSRVVAAANAVSFLRGVVMLGGLTFVTIVVTLGLGGSTDTVRDTLYGLLVPMIGGSMVGGVLLPRLGYRPLVATGLAIMALGTLPLVTLSGSTAAVGAGWATVSVGGVGIPLPYLSGVVLFLVPVGLGIGISFAPIMLAVQYGVPARDIGIGSSLVQFMGNLGGSIGLSLLGTLQANEFSALSPVGPDPCPALAASGQPAPACVGQHLAYFASVQHAFFVSFQDLFWAVVGIAVLAFVFGLLVTGKLPGTAGTAPAPIVGGDATPEPVPMGPA
ncbi:MAG TPA: MFS transporter [Thermoplasmata archaeon]|nr:MFS transporter [Thermoplasmata archaeon]